MLQNTSGLRLDARQSTFFPTRAELCLFLGVEFLGAPGIRISPRESASMNRFLFAVIVLGCPTLSILADDQAQTKKPEPKKVPPAFVQLLKGSADDFIKKFDKNKDGFLSKDE